MHMIRTVQPLSHFEPEKTLMWSYMYCVLGFIYIYMYVFWVAGTHFDLKIFLYNLSL